MARTFMQRLRRSTEGCRLRFSFGLDLFDDGYCLDLFGYLIPLPFMDRWCYEPHEIMESWGFTTCDRTIQLRWGRRCKVVYLPWDFTHIKTEYQDLLGGWFVSSKRYDPDEESYRARFEYPYTYTLKNGEVQHRTAEVKVSRSEWRWRCLKWLPLFAKKRTYIDVQFSDEVGERTGSWKGGTIGCSYEMRPGETSEDTLRRMEREREFN